jgi:hypothetical protein
MMRSLILLLLFVKVGMLAVAQAPKYSNDFMYIGVGAQNLGMGNAVVASTNDVTAGYWNPAGLTKIPNKLQMTFMHNEYFASIAKYDYFAFAVPLDSNKHAFSAGFLRFGVDDIPNTLDLIEPDGTVNYDNVKSFSIGDYGFLFSYANAMVKNLSVGATAKVVYRKAGSFANAWGFGIDVGAIYTLKNWRLGLTVKDITTTFNAWSFSFTDKEKQILQQEDNVVPKNSLEITLPRVQLGAAYVKAFKKIELTAEIDWEITTDGKRNTLVATNRLSFDPRIGLEAGFFKIFYLRAGVGNFQKMLTDGQSKAKMTVQPNLGVGLRFKTIAVDYAYTDVGKASNNQYSHVVSARIGFNSRKNKSSDELLGTPETPQENTIELPDNQ